MSKDALNQLYVEVRRLDEKVKPTLRARLISGYNMEVEASLRMAVPRRVTGSWGKEDPPRIPEPDFRQLNVRQRFRISGMAAEDPQARRSFLTRLLDIVSHKKNQALVNAALDEPEPVVEAQDGVNEKELLDKPLPSRFTDLVEDIE